MGLKLTLAVLLVSGLLNGEPAAHKFELWGKGKQVEKLFLYWGWSNGFLQARGQRGVEFADCLEGMTYDQAIAMIDKQYRDNPEKWSRPLGEQILEALTINGGPCEGKNPLAIK